MLSEDVLELGAQVAIPQLGVHAEQESKRRHRARALAAQQLDVSREKRQAVRPGALGRIWYDSEQRLHQEHEQADRGAGARRR